MIALLSIHYSVVRVLTLDWRMAVHVTARKTGLQIHSMLWDRGTRNTGMVQRYTRDTGQRVIGQDKTTRDTGMHVPRETGQGGLQESARETGLWHHPRDVSRLICPLHLLILAILAVPLIRSSSPMVRAAV